MLISLNQFKKFESWNKSQLESNEPWRVKLAKDYLSYEPKFIGFDTFLGLPANNEKTQSLTLETLLLVLNR